jgi:hypothetical protein
MKKFLLIIFIVFDAAIVCASGWFLYMKLTTNKNPLQDTPLVQNITGAMPDATPTPTSTASTPESGAQNTSTSPSMPVTAATVAGSGPNVRKIGFTYRNSKARKVMIRADFTGWRAEPMQKDAATHTWKYMAVLDPGEYAYCFSVDDKSIRDPANKRTKQVGKTVVSSIVVQPPSSPN